MIEPMSAPGMAVDIRLSTLEPVQQLGARLAQVLSGELSRLRADAAFAAATGIVVHAPEVQLETLRAQHSSVLGHAMLELRTRSTSLGADPDSALRDVETDRRRKTAEQEERHPQGDSWASDEAGIQEDRAESDITDEDPPQEEQHSVNSGNAMLVSALRQALEQCRVVAGENGLTGNPLAVALPARHWLERYAPADLRYQAVANSGTAPGDGIADLLILCLAFDGRLGESRAVVGLLFIADRCVGSLRSEWSCAIPAEGVAADVCQIRIQQAAALVSAATAICGEAEQEQTRCAGLRVGIETVVDEPDYWFCNTSDWTWH